MRSFASVLFCSLALQAQQPSPQLLENVKQFSYRENLSCNQVVQPSTSRAITIEMIEPSAPRHGVRTSIDTTNLLQDVFAPSAGTDFEWDHWGTLKGKKTAVYRYSNQINGQTHAGYVYADEATGAISRIIFRNTATTAHLFCSAHSR